jgi:two-component system nitrate/nitrite sensor histidine kinase NarX
MPAMKLSRPRLSTKLVWIVITSLAVALTAIGFTLFESWKLEGGAAVINDMGSERMRSYRIAYLLSEIHRDPSAAPREALLAEVERLESILVHLRRGDPARPLLLPRDSEIVAGVDAVEAQWVAQIRPFVKRIASETDPQVVATELRRFRSDIEAFVSRIDDLVRAVEEHNSRTIALLRLMQFGLIALAIAGTVMMIYLMFLLVVRPVATLNDGIRDMTSGEFGTRLPVESRDEFGELAEGFNRMAGRLQDLYGNLEKRVAEKTRDLAEKNRELEALYGVTRLLNQPGQAEELSREFLRRLTALFGAAGGAVRLIDPATGRIHLHVQERLDPVFAGEERCLEKGECLCGEAAQRGAGMVEILPRAQMSNAIYHCQKAGYRTVSAFPIRFRNQRLGIFNLFFTDERALSPQDRRVLETLGQHLGAAIENQRLASRDRELAVFEERNLLAQELHDSIAQSLAFLNMQAQMLEDSLRRGKVEEAQGVVSQIREGVQESYDDVRELLTHFRTRVGQQQEMGGALRSMLQRFEAQTGIRTTFRESGAGAPLAAEDQLQVLHILQEALSNVRKHAGAGTVGLEVQRGGVCRFRVSDDGRGFDPERLADGSENHIGLRIMRERARRIGGELEVKSRPGEGTEVTLTLPITERAAA